MRADQAVRESAYEEPGEIVFAAWPFPDKRISGAEVLILVAKAGEEKTT
jgi:hypothetical protein